MGWQAPRFGPKITDPYATDVWFYYENTVGLRFDKDGFSEAVWLLPQSARDGQLPFDDWPVLNYCLTLGFLRDFLADHNIRFSENEEGGFILTESLAHAVGFPYQDGMEVPFSRRPIEVLQRVRYRNLLPSFLLPDDIVADRGVRVGDAQRL